MADKKYGKFDRRVKAASATKNPKTKIKILLNAAQIYKALWLYGGSVVEPVEANGIHGRSGH